MNPRLAMIMDNLRKLFLSVVIVMAAYFVICLFIAIFNATYNLKISPEQIWLAKNKSDHKYTVAIISSNFRGEKNQAEMVYNSLNKMGHSSYIYVFDEKLAYWLVPLRYIHSFFIYTLNFLTNTDFTFITSFHLNIDIPNPKIMYISVPPSWFVEHPLFTRILLNSDNQYFLDINPPSDWISKLLNKSVIQKYAMVGIPASQYKSSKRRSLLIYGSLWGREAMADVLASLAKQEYMYFIHSDLRQDPPGIKVIQDPSSSSLADLNQILNEHGIVICVHSNLHLAAGLPSSRIFEIISSGAIAISDMNPFVIKNFGDSILYFDQTRPAAEIFKQIDSHVKWVQENPEKAEAMARRAHKILQENFTTELFVKDMIKLHQDSR